MESASGPVPWIAPADVKSMLGRDDVLLVDVREPGEIAVSGKVKGALNIPRGLLESRADPHSPDHHPAFDKSRTVVLYCVSGTRSGIAGETLRRMGYSKVFNLGRFEEWVQSGGAVER